MMKKLTLLAIVLFSFAPVYGQDVNGDTLTIDGKLILKVWGTHYERGYAHGYLLGNQVKRVMDDYVVDYIFQGSSMLYNLGFMYYQGNFEVDEKYRGEVEGIFDGIGDAGVSLYNAALGRDFTVDDGLMVNALGDLSGVLSEYMQGNYECSTITSWGTSTQNDPQLNGGMVVTRNFDWDMHPALLSNHLITVNLPDEADEANWINFGFTGLIAPFSAVSEDGIAAFQNVGNYNNQTVPGPFYPISFSIRNGIELADYNGDSQHNRYDIAGAISDEISVSSWIITTADAEEGIAVEVNNVLGAVVRTRENNIVIPDNHLAATNHHRLLYPPSYCYRYDNIADSLAVNEEMTIERSWEMLGGAAGVAWNVHTVQFAPSADLLKFAAAPNTSTPAYTQEPTVFSFTELFEPPSGVQGRNGVLSDFSLSAYPNPFNASTTIPFILDRAGQVEMTVYDVLGRRVWGSGFRVWEAGTHEFVWDAEGMASGVYFVRLELQSAGTLRHSEAGRVVLVR